MPALLAAARQPLYLFVLLAAIATGVSVSIYLLPLGLVIYATCVMLAARDPGFQQQSARAAKRQRLTSPTFRTMIDEIDRSQQALESAIGQAEGPLRRILQSVLNQSSELVEQAHMLADRGQVIEQYLSANNPAQLQSQIDGVDIQLANTTDSYTVQQLQGTRQALVGRQGNGRDLQTYIGRIMAQLTNIDANLDNVLAETIRLRTADAVSADSVTNQVAQQLSDLNADMTAFRQVLDGAITQTAV
jgi:hypothetical protein